MKAIVYTGPHAAVDIPSVGVTAVRGEPVDISDATARALLSGPHWKLFKEPAE